MSRRFSTVFTGLIFALATGSALAQPTLDPAARGALEERQRQQDALRRAARYRTLMRQQHHAGDGFKNEPANRKNVRHGNLLRTIVSLACFSAD